MDIIRVIAAAADVNASSTLRRPPRDCAHQYRCQSRCSDKGFSPGARWAARQDFRQLRALERNELGLEDAHEGGPADGAYMRGDVAGYMRVDADDHVLAKWTLMERRLRLRLGMGSSKEWEDTVYSSEAVLRVRKPAVHRYDAQRGAGKDEAENVPPGTTEGRHVQK